MVALSGCAAEVVSANCIDLPNPGIALSFEDSSTGARYPFMDIVAIASEGAFRDTARAASITGDPHSVTGVGLVFDRAGTYDLTVQAAGYALWTASDVRVREEDNQCRHVITRNIVARLQATP
ncbi:MAG TPA: hypothetical protein VLB00_11920 [Gemmatimonadales bacterium]|nr:hypothetical protein [Gemmatimonadales bacterium]